MLYVEYIDFKKKYIEAQKLFDNILSEKETLFSMTQPKAVQFDKERVSGGTKQNTFDDYLVIKDNRHLDAKLEEIRSILKDREKLLKVKEEELRNSKDWLDIIFIYYYIEKLSIRKIAKRIPFGTTEIYRKIKKIEKNIN